MNILDELNQGLAALKKLGVTPNSITLGMKQCLEFAQLGPTNGFLILERLGLQIKFSDEYDLFDLD